MSVECRSNWYVDSGVRQNHGDREVRCNLPEGHEGLHVELIDGQAANAWPPTFGLRRRSNEEQIAYFQDAVCRLIGERDETRARLAEVEAERDAAQDLARKVMAERDAATATLTELAPGSLGTQLVVAKAQADNLAAENARLRQERDEARHNLEAWYDIAEARRPVVEAAEAWRGQFARAGLVATWAGNHHTLIDAVDAYRAGQKGSLDRPESTESQHLHPGDAQDAPDGREAHRPVQPVDFGPHPTGLGEILSVTPADPPGLDAAIEAAHEAGHQRLAEGWPPARRELETRPLDDVIDAAVRAAAPALRAGALREAADWADGDLIVGSVGDWLRERADRIGGAT